MSEREQLLRRFHAERPGATARAFGRSGSYARVVARLRERAGAPRRVLDLACGDGPLVELLGEGAVGVDMSPEELAAARARGWPGGLVRARAQALPFAAATFDACTCHLAFMLFDDVEVVVAELARVLAPGAPFVALIGGGPVEHADPADRARDLYHRFLELAKPHLRPTGLGDPRTRSEAGWRELFAGAAWADVQFERVVVDAGGTFEQTWELLGGTYSLYGSDTAALRDQLRAELAGTDVLRCEVVCWLASVIRR